MQGGRAELPAYYTQASVQWTVTLHVLACNVNNCDYLEGQIVFSLLKFIYISKRRQKKTPKKKKKAQISASFEVTEA